MRAIAAGMQKKQQTLERCIKHHQRQLQTLRQRGYNMDAAECASLEFLSQGYMADAKVAKQVQRLVQRTLAEEAEGL